MVSEEGIQERGAGGEPITQTQGTQTTTTGTQPTGASSTGSNQPFGLEMDDYLFSQGIQVDPIKPGAGLENIGLKLTGTGAAAKVVNNHEGGLSSILLNSDRVIINSKASQTIVAGAGGVALTSPQKVNIDADNTVTIHGTNGVFLGVPNKGNPAGNYPPASLLTNGAFTKGGKKLKSYPSKDVPYEPMVLGLKLINWLDDLLVVLKYQQILTPVGLGAVREDAQWDFKALQMRLNELVSTYAYIDGYSHETPDFASLTPPPEKVTQPKTSIEVNANVSIINPPPPPGPITNPDATKPGFYNGMDAPTPQIK